MIYFCLQPDPELRQQVIKLLTQNPITLSSLFPTSISNSLSTLIKASNDAVNVTQRLNAAELDLQRITSDISSVINMAISHSAVSIEISMQQVWCSACCSMSIIVL